MAIDDAIDVNIDLNGFKQFVISMDCYAATNPLSPWSVDNISVICCNLCYVIN